MKVYIDRIIVEDDDGEEIAIIKHDDEEARLRVLEGYITGLNCFGKEYLK